MATQKERAEQRRRDRLEDVQRQVDDGTLTVRKMTAKERDENPPRARPSAGRRR